MFDKDEFVVNSKFLVALRSVTVMFSKLLVLLMSLTVEPSKVDTDDRLLFVTPNKFEAFFKLVFVKAIRKMCLIKKSLSCSVKFNFLVLLRSVTVKPRKVDTDDRLLFV